MFLPTTECVGIILAKTDITRQFVGRTTRDNDKQTEALGAIFTGAAGGPMAQLAPLFGKNGTMASAT